MYLLITVQVSCRFIATLRGHVSAVYQVGLCFDGRYLPIAHTVYIGILIFCMFDFQIAWSSDSRLLCSGSSDSTLKVC